MLKKQTLKMLQKIKNKKIKVFQDKWPTLYKLLLFDFFNFEKLTVKTIEHIHRWYTLVLGGDIWWLVYIYNSLILKKINYLLIIYIRGAQIY